MRTQRLMWSPSWGLLPSSMSSPCLQRIWAPFKGDSECGCPDLPHVHCDPHIMQQTSQQSSVPSRTRVHAHKRGGARSRATGCTARRQQAAHVALPPPTPPSYMHGTLRHVTTQYAMPRPPPCPDPGCVASPPGGRSPTTLCMGCLW